MSLGLSNDRAMESMVVSFKKLPADAVAIAGGKGASLARIAAAGFPVPPGFVVCTAALSWFLGDDGARLVRGLAGLNVEQRDSLEKASRAICDWICAHSLPRNLEEAIHRAYVELGRGTPDALVAVRSSGISEDSETASFAGQQETYLNVSGTDAVTDRIRDCWASFFSQRALFYRGMRAALTEASIAVVVQEMVQSERSGVMFTVDPVQKRREHMVIEAVFGLGEGIVSGSITPDHLVIDRENGSIVEEFVAYKSSAVVWDGADAVTTEVKLPEEKAKARVLTEADVASLRQMGLRLEEHFGKPQDVEWSFRGEHLVLLQSRPITAFR